MNSPRVALVIMYNGSQPDDMVKSQLLTTLSQSGYRDNTKPIDAYFMEEHELVSAVASKAANADTVSKHFYHVPEQTQEIEADQAIAILAAAFKKIMSSSKKR